VDKEMIWECAQKTFAVESEELRALTDRVSRDELYNVVNQLLRCKKDRHNVILCGCGTSGMAAKVIMHLFCCLEYSACFMPPSDALHGESGFIREGDLVFLFSKGGQSEELGSMLSIAKEKKAVVVAVVSKSEASLATEADLILTVPIEKEADRYNTLPTSSILNVISIFHAIFNALIQAEDYQLSQLGAIHPGGAVGKKLRPDS